jgi:diacylglycerol kinase family enzyme
MADVGLGGDIAERANNSTKVLGGFATYLFSSVISFASYKPKKVRITIDDQEFDERITSVFVANGEYCGGGMSIASGAEVDDGFFDVVVVREMSKWSVLSLAPKLYSGKLHTQPGVKNYKAQHVHVESNEEILINIDGEQPGTTPVTFTLLSTVLNFKI